MLNNKTPRIFMPCLNSIRTYVSVYLTIQTSIILFFPNEFNSVNSLITISDAKITKKERCRHKVYPYKKNDRNVIKMLSHVRQFFFFFVETSHNT